MFATRVPLSMPDVVLTMTYQEAQRLLHVVNKASIVIAHINAATSDIATEVYCVLSKSGVVLPD